MLAAIPGVLYQYVLEADGTSRFIFLSAGCRDLFEMEADYLLADIGRLWALVHDDDIERLINEDIRANNEGTFFSIEVRIITPSGQTKWVQLSSRPLSAARGEPAVWCGFTHDITGRRMIEQEIADHETVLAHLAATDPLTDLPNRRHFFETAARHIAHARRHGTPLTVVSFDIDGLKAVNDQLGHAHGDRVITRFADTLSSSARAEDLAGRLGGDEFSCLLPGIKLDGGDAFAQRVLSAAADDPYLQRSGVTASAGVASLDPGDTLDSWLGRADRALYLAKDAGRNTVVAT